MSHSYTFDDIVFSNELYQNTIIQAFVFVSCFTYASMMIGSICTWGPFEKYCDDSTNELVGKSMDETETDIKVEAPIPVTKRVKVDIPLVKEELEQLKQTHTFGICRWSNGPFLSFSDLTYNDNKLYGIRNNVKTSVAKCIEETKHTTRPRWINHLCFMQDDKPILFKDYLKAKHGLTFS